MYLTVWCIFRCGGSYHSLCRVRQATGAVYHLQAERPGIQINRSGTRIQIHAYLLYPSAARDVWWSHCVCVQKISEVREEIQRKDALLEKFSSFFNERLQTFEDLQARQKRLLYDADVLSEIQSATGQSPAKKTPVSTDYSNAFTDSMQVDDGVLDLSDQ